MSMADEEQNDMMSEDEEGMEADEMSAVWEHLTPEQKKYFKKIAEKSKENMNYIG